MRSPRRHSRAVHGRPLTMTHSPAEPNGHIPSSWNAPSPCVAPPPREPDEGRDETSKNVGLPGHESAALVRAHTQATDVQLSRLDQLDAASDGVLESYRIALTAIVRAEEFAGSGQAARSREDRRVVLDRHRADGPEDRRDRRIPRWIPWLALGAGAVFDASFVSTVVAQFLDLSPSVPHLGISLLPGLGLALSLLVVGTVLAEALFRHRISLTRATAERNSPLKRIWLSLKSELEEVPEVTGRTRKPDDLPWSRAGGAVLLALAVLGLMAIWAFIRAQYALDGKATSLGPLEPAFVVLLMLLSLATIALKILAHNPYATRETKTRKALDRAEELKAELDDRARAEIERHHRRWLRLGTILTRAEYGARAVIEEACASILDARGVRPSGVPMPSRSRCARSTCPTRSTSMARRRLRHPLTVDSPFPRPESLPLYRRCCLSRERSCRRSPWTSSP